MYLHGYMMFPDYVAVAMLIGTAVFLLCLTLYAVVQLVSSEIAGIYETHPLLTAYLSEVETKRV